MTKNELIALLNDIPGDPIVVMSKDSEGNNYSPCANVFHVKYRADTTWSGEIGMIELTDDDRKLGYTEEDVMEDGELAIVLFPTN